MGRIKTKLIKRMTFKLFRENQDKFKKTFKENKGIVSNIMDFPSKKMRNAIAGYITKLVKIQEKQLK